MTLPEIKQPLVSVIMPTYNHAQFIGEAIDSVLNQTYKNLELIIIDNYSEDNTEEIVKSFNNQRIKYVKFRNNGVIVASRNVGMKMAKGKYFAFLDSDDLWLPNKLEKQIPLFERDGKVGLVYSDIILFNEKGKEKRSFEFKKPHRGNVFPELLLENFINTQTVLIRKEAFDCFDTFFDGRLIM